ncbi:HlyD family efflux transporter periplasmic adaptor subunit [Humisphaera borealis]|uniref:HlyD family efflux transporter periplasmic adaptor subunit n=1 Tax=Humisphaera borealis TaxID=2807512 RepID=A0A7M2X3K7_9BACT|nr:HlyD family efflux transporter periplasmic adaptor subunit [Humisphaera borealis]QOV91350.1 HlyD family efflux transporter periplasmic adaptor subunit [Humisphaera borealis]
MTTFAVPSEASMPDRSRKWLTVTILGMMAVVGVSAYYGRSYILPASSSGISDFKFYTVTPTEMQVKVFKDGELQALNSIEILSNVEAIATIVQIVKEGATVNAGDVLVELDSSAIRQKIEDTTLELQRAESDVAAARNTLAIQKSQNDANLEAGTVDVQLGKLAIQQYVDGTYPQDLYAAEIALKMAQIKLANKEDDFKQIKELYTKSFVNLADVKAAELDLETVRNDVSKAQGALTVLSKYTHPMTLAGKQSYLKQAEQKLARTKVENQNNLTKAETALETQETAKKIMERRLARYQEQLEYCTIKAPQSGLVVYNNTSSRDGGQPMQEGAQVRERQVMLRLPDTSSMKAVVRINESQVIRLTTSQRAVVRVTGIREPIGASVTRISPVSDSSSRYFSPDTREYPVELALDWTPPNLKPGIGVSVEILVDSIQNANVVPLASIYSAGPDTYVFEKAADGQSVKPKKVSIGVANETHVVIADGVQPGAHVLLLQAGQGRDLLEKNGIRPRVEDEPAVRKPEKAPGDALHPPSGGGPEATPGTGNGSGSGKSGTSNRRPGTGRPRPEGGASGGKSVSSIDAPAKPLKNASPKPTD